MNCLMYEKNVVFTKTIHKNPAGGGGVVQMLRDAPEYGSCPPHVLEVLGWCFRYHERTPTRDDIMRAMTGLASPKRRAA